MNRGLYMWLIFLMYRSLLNVITTHNILHMIKYNRVTSDKEIPEFE